MKSNIGILLIIAIFCTTNVWCENIMSTLAVMIIASLAFQRLVLPIVEDLILNKFISVEEQLFIRELISRVVKQQSASTILKKEIEASHLRSQARKTIKKNF